MKKYQWILMMLPVIFSACTKITEVTSSYKAAAVVQGYLYQGKPVLLQVTEQIPAGSNTTGQTPIDTLHVFIIHNGDTVALTHTDTGYYKSDSTFIIQPAQTYSLLFYFNGSYVTAVTTVPATPTNFSESETSMTLTQINLSNGPPSSPPSMPSPLNLTWTNDNQGYYLVVAKNTEVNPEAVYTGVDTLHLAFQTQPTQANSEEVRSQQFEYYGSTLIILFHVNPEYASLYFASSSSSQNLTSPSTNVVNGYGIFTAVSSDTLNFAVIKG